MAIFRRPLALLSRTALGRQIPAPLGRQIPAPLGRQIPAPLGRQIPRFSSAVPASRLKGTTIIAIIVHDRIVLAYDSRITGELDKEDKEPQIVSDSYKKVVAFRRPPLQIAICGHVESASKLVWLLENMAFPTHADPASQLAEFAVFCGAFLGPAEFGLIIAGFDSNNNPSLCVVDYKKVDKQPPVVMKEKVDRLVVRGADWELITSELTAVLSPFDTFEILTSMCESLLLDAALCNPVTGGYLTVSYLTCDGLKTLIRKTVLDAVREGLDEHNNPVQGCFILIHSHRSVAQPSDIKNWLEEMGPGRVVCVGPRLTKLRGQYYMRVVFFANTEGASGIYDEAKEVQEVPIFATKGEGFKKFTGGAEEIWVCWLTKANLGAMVPQIDD